MEWNFTYENQGENEFLVYELEGKEQLDTVGVGMISNNQILHILPVTYTQMNEKRYLRYSVSSNVSLDCFFGGIVSRTKLLNILRGICEVIEESSKYMLESSMLVLDRRYIYVNASTGDVELIYLPIMNQERQLEFAGFLKQFMLSAQFDVSEDCGYVAAIINHLNVYENFSLKEFKALLHTLSNQENRINEQLPVRVTPQPVTPPPAPPVFVKPTVLPQTPVETSAPQKKSKKSLFGEKAKKKDPVAGEGVKNPSFAIPGLEKQSVALEMPKQEKKEKEVSKKKFGFGRKEKKKSDASGVSGISIPGAGEMSDESNVKRFTKAEAHPVNWVQPVSCHDDAEQTMLFTNDEQTTMLFDQDELNIPKAILVQRKNGKRTLVNKSLFRIGKKQSFVDLWVSDNKVVSRSHADIIIHEGNFFIRDNNSTNHTYLNGTLLAGNQEYPLTNGDQIVLGNEVFLFELE